MNRIFFWRKRDPEDDLDDEDDDDWDDEDDDWDDEDDRDDDEADDDDDDDPDWQPGLLVREGRIVRLRRHVPGNRAAFQRWYADPEIAHMLRHDQRPLNDRQSKGYFDSFILPLSARGHCFAIHEAATDRLIGTTAITDFSNRRGQRSAMFRIVIGEKDVWSRGYGTEATRLVMEQGFGPLGLDEVRLEVFRHNPRALRAYERVGFRVAGEHVEHVGRKRQELHVIEMVLPRVVFEAIERRHAESEANRPVSPDDESDVSGGVN